MNFTSRWRILFIGIAVVAGARCRDPSKGAGRAW